MFISLLDELRLAGIPASPKEHLTLLQALEAEVIEPSPEEFYYLARTIYVKDEGLIDRFDQVFAKVFRGIFDEDSIEGAELPEEWLKAVAEKFLSPEEMEQIKSLGSWEEILAHARELAGCRVRLTVLTPPSGPQGSAEAAPERPLGFRPASGRSLLRHAGTWVGDDLEERLAEAYANRTMARF